MPEMHVFSRRSLLLGSVATLASVGSGSPLAAALSAKAVRMGRISGPVTGGKGWAFGSPTAKWLELHGYGLEEYFIEGTAFAYDPVAGSNVGADGKWRSAPVRPAAYKTRLMVALPLDRTKFNGKVIINWQNVTEGIDLGAPGGRELFRQGYGWIGATVQQIAHTGYPRQPGTPDAEAPPPGLKDWDPARYGSLVHPGDAYSFDIYAQIARVAKGMRADGPDPMRGLRARRLITMGGSQSAMFLGAYINMAHAHDRLFDGFMLQVHWGVCWWPGQTGVEMWPQGIPVGKQRIRDDQGTPIMVINSESEAASMHPVMQPDTRTFRFWEVAGTCHEGNPPKEQRDAIFERDGLAALIRKPANRNTIDWSFVEDAGLRALTKWIEAGRAPPRFPRIPTMDGAPPIIARDTYGNAQGGIRMPEMEAPVAVQMGLNVEAPLDRFGGLRQPFDNRLLSSLYATRSAYLEQYDAATIRLSIAGGVLLDDVAEIQAHGRKLADLLPVR